MVGVAAADIENGDFKVWNETEPNFPKAAVSSSFIHFVLTPKVWDNGSIYADGDSIWMIDINSGIYRWLRSC